MQAFFDEFRERQSGIAVAMVVKGATDAAVDLGSDTISDPSQFEIGSVTKTMTALALAVMVTQNEIRLSDRIDRFFDVGPWGAVTLEQLATHTSGLPRVTDWLLADASTHPEDPWVNYTNERLLEDLRSLIPDPTVEARYSNIGYMLLGLAMETASGESLEALLRRTVFAPLGMTTAGVGPPSPGLLPGYVRGRRTIPWAQPLPAAGGVTASLGDMRAYATAHLDPPEAMAEPVEMVLRPRVPAPGGQVGLGWHLLDEVTWHNGGTGGFGAYIGINRSARRAIVVLYNAPHRPRMDEIARRWLSES
jgi:serine-type D-Ala-D-Ala carboxypeptidase/endopeptidase